jgi:hypothetical protein
MYGSCLQPLFTAASMIAAINKASVPWRDTVLSYVNAGAQSHPTRFPKTSLSAIAHARPHMHSP